MKYENNSNQKEYENINNETTPNDEKEGAGFLNTLFNLLNTSIGASLLTMVSFYLKKSHTISNHQE
jgi:hypothetical protein